jgi:hypothetical protein
MKSIDELTKHFGKYLLNPEFQHSVIDCLIKPTKYNSLNESIICKTSKIELGFTNKHVIHLNNPETSLSGKNQVVFTHFIFYPATEKYFNLLPFGVTFKDTLAEIENKCGVPTEKTIDEDDFLFGNETCLFYHIGNVKIVFSYDMDKDKLTQVNVEQLRKEITE